MNAKGGCINIALRTAEQGVSGWGGGLIAAPLNGLNQCRGCGTGDAEMMLAFACGAFKSRSRRQESPLFQVFEGEKKVLEMFPIFFFSNESFKRISDPKIQAKQN